MVVARRYIIQKQSEKWRIEHELFRLSHRSVTPRTGGKGGRVAAFRIHAPFGQDERRASVEAAWTRVRTADTPARTRVEIGGKCKYKKKKNRNETKRNATL